MILRNFDFASKYFDIDKNTEFEYLKNSKINGWYKFVNTTFTGLLVVNKSLYFIYDNQKILLTPNHFLEVIEISKKIFEVKLKNENESLICFNSDQNEVELKVSPFEYLDDDDFSWGLFLAQIINNEDRKNNFILNLSDEES